MLSAAILLGSFLYMSLYFRSMLFNLLIQINVVKPKQKERHFMVTKLIRAENADIIACELEAVINNNIYEIEWQALKDSSCWLMGWQ